MSGMTREDLFKKFGEHAGFVGTLHTNDGEKSLYAVAHPVDWGATIHADDTAALFKAYQDAHYKSEDGKFYRTEQDYASAKFVEKNREGAET